MYSTCVTSLRTRGGLLFAFNDYAHGSPDRGPCAYSSSPTTCCCCCCSANSLYSLPIGSGYCYNLYGLRQSSLIQWSPCRKSVYGGLDRLYSSRLPVCDVDFSFYCDEVLRPRQVKKAGGRKKGGLRKCMLLEESDDVVDVDEAEILLSLLTEDVSEDCLLATKETRRLLKNPVVEKRENGEVSKKCRNKKKRVDLGVLESEHSYGVGSVVSSGRKDNRRREEVIRREKEKEDLLRKENQKRRLKEEYSDASVTTGTSRRKEGSIGILRKTGNQDHNKEEKKAESREENWKVNSSNEGDLVKIEENRQKVRKEGSSCSSYYSFSSTGDYEIDDEVELSGERYLEEESASHKKDSKNNVVFNQEARKEEGHRHESYRENHGVNLEKKSTKSDYMVGSSVVESDFRKKSEKKLADVSVQELELIEKDSQQDSNISTGHESNYKKHSGYHVNYDGRQGNSTTRTNVDEQRKWQHLQTSSEVQKQKMELREETSRKESRVSMERESNYKKYFDYHLDYDDRLEISTARTELDEERQQQRSQTSNEVQRQTETTMKHKQFVEKQESHSTDVTNFYGCQKMGKGEVTEVSEVQDIDNRKTSVSRQRAETNVKEDNCLTNIDNSTNVIVKQNQYDQASEHVDLNRKIQQLAKKEGKSILKKRADKGAKQEENVNVSYGSSTESIIIKKEDSKRRDDKLSKMSLTHTGHSGEADLESRNETKLEMQVGVQTKLPQLGDSSQGYDSGVSHTVVSGKIGSEGRNKAKSEIQVGIQTKLTEPSSLSPRSNAGIATDEGDDGSLQVVLISPELYHETHGEASGTGAQELPSKFVHPEGTIESAAQMEQSSTQYVGEFVNQVKDEFFSSEVQEEKKTKFVHEEQHPQNLETKTDGGQTVTKGPSDEIWNVDEPSVKESSITEHQDDASKAGKDTDKRTGRSLWNVISDIVLLRWSSRPESHNSGRKAGGKSSPTLSTSADTWFSGHEAAEKEEVTEEKEQQTITLGLSGSNQGEKSHSHVAEGSSSAKFDHHLKHDGVSVPSSSGAPKLQPIRSLLHYGVLSEGMPATTAMSKPSIPLPSFRKPFSPVVQGVSEAEEAKASVSGSREGPKTESVLKTESSVDEGELSRKKFQRQDHVIRDRFDEWDEAYRLEAEQRKVDEMFMWEALLEAQHAADNWEVPVGAVLVHNGKIIARGFNRVEELRDSTAHAEMICIREASNMFKSWRLSETTLYVTLEPCPMCAGAILQARVDTVVWGAPNKLLGADGSWIRLFPDGDGGNGLELSDKPPAPVHPFHPKIVVRRGVLSSECADAMQQFFKLRRKKKDDKSEPSKTAPSGSHRPFKFFSKMHQAFNQMSC